ncbi:MAG: hypothetical protein WCI05_19935, partial [Myxococcales bacterium]
MNGQGSARLDDRLDAVSFHTGTLPRSALRVHVEQACDALTFDFDRGASLVWVQGSGIRGFGKTNVNHLRPCF